MVLPFVSFPVVTRQSSHDPGKDTDEIKQNCLID